MNRCEISQGCHCQGKVREIRSFSRSGKSRGILYQVREIVNSTSNSVKVGEFTLG